jgi:hypothetical protein
MNFFLYSEGEFVGTSGKSMQTIFESIVRNENDHTNLLRNVMEQYPQVAASALPYLAGKCVSGADALEFRTQYFFQGSGGRMIPDLLVEGPEFRCIIEAKIDPRLQLTPAQQDGYKECFGSVAERHLCFLVPDGWEHSNSINGVQESLRSAGIVVHQCRWPELVEKISEAANSLNDRILTEAVRFWRWRFQLQSLSPKERDFLNNWSSEQYIAFRKLHKTIDDAKDLFASRGYETELEGSFTGSYSFYLKRGRLYLLSIGIWTPSGVPLSYGFHATKSIWLRPNPVPVSPISILEHNLWPLGPETWDSPEKIYASVKSFIDSQNYE